jgi:hypothetical protein
MGPSAERLRVLSLTPGRMRLHLPGWTAGDADRVEARLDRVRGVESVQANPLTGNLLIRFDPRSGARHGLRAVGRLLILSRGSPGTDLP